MRMMKIKNICYLLFFQSIIQFGYCNAKCKNVSSQEHGKLSLQATEKMNLKCLGDFVFENITSGEKFCLKKGVVGKDKISCEGCTCGLENKDKVNPKIVGGSYVGENQYPWFGQIMVYVKGKRFPEETLVMGCGGSLITDKVVATAAHCVKPLVGELKNHF